MARFALIVLVLGAIVFALVVVGFGVHPPQAPTRQVTHVLPNDRFQPQQAQ